ncbi:MAG: hypothetical protein V5A14_01430 [Desulfohalobiaceae bacterium]
MSEVSLQLHLNRRCIATEAKRAYERALSDSFRSPGSAELESRVELLKDLLEQVDLPGLRADHPELRSGAGTVRILREGSAIRIEAEGRILHSQHLPQS